VIDIDITDEKRREQVERRSQRLESIGTLTSGIAHDLNNVLTPITMGAKLLRRKAIDPQQTGLLDTISASAERGAAMIKQLLSFAGGTSGPREAIDLQALIQEACGILQHTLTQTVVVKSEISETPWSIPGDSTELSQVLMNLAINARDAMPNGGTLTFEAANVSLADNAPTLGLTPGKYVRVSVIDTGIGIQKDVIERIFDPFFTTKDQGKGTGLGLATCMGIIKSHAGNMSVYSEPGKGTRFTIYLPAQQGDVEVTAEVLADTYPEGSGQRVLVVDDEESILQMVQVTLESYGYRAITVVGGAAAIAMFEQRHAEIDLVIIDMMMPDVDGPMAIKAMRSIAPEAKIIASSGLRKPDHGKDSIEGSDGFLPKPYTDELLLQTIKNVLNE
jgi:two-component system cell cycle sensor histidine kinase/response regulator CckA